MSPTSSQPRRAWLIPNARSAKSPTRWASEPRLSFTPSSLANGALTIKGEKKEEKEEKGKDYYLSERRYGSFARSFAVPEGVDIDKIEATFSKGVLTIKMPKTAEAQKNEKKIEVKAG